MGRVCAGSLEKISPSCIKSYLVDLSQALKRIHEESVTEIYINKWT